MGSARAPGGQRHLGIARGYNLDVKNPHTVDDAHVDPTELLAEYQKAQAGVAEVRERLRKELETALIR